MFSKTKESFIAMVENVKKIYRCFRYMLILFTAIYFVYALLSKTGIFAINLVLAILFVGYSIFEIITFKKRVTKETKNLVKKSYKWTKLFLKAISLGIMIYGVYTATTKPALLTIVIITLTTLLWITQIIFEIILSILQKQTNRMVSSIKDDIHNVKENFNKSKEKITNKINQLKYKIQDKQSINNEIIIDDNDNHLENRSS